MTASVIIAALAMILLVIIAVVALYVLRESVSRMSEMLNRIESRTRAAERHQSHALQTVLDRLMTIKWEDFAAIKNLDEDEEGGFTPPTYADEPESVQTGGDWGSLSTLHERMRLLDNEQEILNEDFDESGEPRR